MRQLSTQNRWQAWKGLVLQAAALVLLLTAGVWFQRNLGLLGLALSELMFLVLAVGYTLAQRTPLREVFPVSVPSVRDVFGTLFILAGGSAIGYMSIYLAAALLPGQFAKVLKGLNSAISGDTLATFAVVAILAPICEEAIERGAVLSHFRSWEKKWAIIWVIGLFFGIMHTDPIRFVNTTVMGAACAYLMVKRDNFLLPVMLHFVNNGGASLLKIIMPFNTDNTDALLEKMDPVLSLGAAMILFCAAPFCIAVSHHLFTDKLAPDASPEEKRARSRKISRFYIVAAIVMGVLLIGGLILMLTNKTFTGTYNSIAGSSSAGI
ncbi:Membrane protease YdiL, CAAX protease family [Ruminococcaceae bacterium YRB3002]|nr:Membrane protease YdiL, CAAX protease family [Ruminococcaceae bacterium YRB3002]